MQSTEKFMGFSIAEILNPRIFKVLGQVIVVARLDNSLYNFFILLTSIWIVCIIKVK